ncbi:FecR family protein [Bacteroides sp.]|uniref:FecR family protein n=1 Tax=Bacteroides sp. TaxID=29523 RepID=UPI002FC9A030
MKLDSTILTNYLDNKATLEEQKQVLAYLSTEEGQHDMALHLDQDIEAFTDRMAETWLDHDVPTKRMKRRFLNHISPVRSWKVALRVAATVIPFLLLSSALFFLSDRLGVFAPPDYVSLTVPCGEQIHLVLQDGTLVHMNSSSRIRYPKKMGLFAREIELSGEAYFTVAKDKERPFVIDLNGVKVRVTGTEFNVKAYPDESYVQVMLYKGSLLLENQTDRTYPLRPGECADYDRTHGECHISRAVDAASIIGWQSRSLNFYRTPFRDILKTLERQYDVTFRLTAPELLDVRFTLSTSKVQVADILQDLEMVSSIHFTAADDSGKAFVVSPKQK